jgi:hypothetical protein
VAESNPGVDGPQGVDLRALLDDAIAKIEPLLRSAAQAQAHGDQSPCTWCPICKAANAVKGQEQDLFSSIASQGGALLSVLKDAVGGLNGGSAGPKHAAADPAAPDAAESPAFTEIPVTIKP